MNKDKFFKFFEIGKLDKGLFRIWIVLAIVWIAYVFVVDTFDWRYREYQEEKFENLSCLPLASTGRYHIVQPPDSDSFSLRASFYKDGFATARECKKVANRDRNDFYLALILTILSPFSLIIIWLFGKKITLWIRRGFK